MPDVTSEASLRFTSTGADKAAADARKLEDSLKSVQRQAQRTAASLKSPLGITAAAAPSVRAAASGRAGGRSLKAPPSGDKLGGPLGIKLAEAVIDAFQKRAAVLTAISTKEQAAAARASVAQAEATTKAVEAEAKATAKAAEAGLKSSGKAGEAKAKSTAKTGEDETKASTKAAQTQLKTTVQASEAKTKATVRSGDAELKAAVQAGEAKAKAAAKAADAEAKAALKSSKAAQARTQAVATSLRTASQIIAPVTSLIPPVLTGIAAAGSGLGLLGAAAIAVAAPVTLLIKSFKWISDAAEAASENFLKAQRVMRGGPDVAAEQERQQRALTALSVTVGTSAGKVMDQFDKLATGLRSGSFSDAAQKQLDKFGITQDKLKEFEDKTGNIDQFKALEKFVETQDRIKEAIARAKTTGDTSKIEKAQSVWDEWIKTLDQIGPEFSRAVQGASKETIAAGRKHQQDLDAAMPLKPRAEVSDDADKFGIAVNRMKAVWDRLFQVVGEGAMPAATAAVSKWADVLLAVAPKLAEIGTYLTKEAWSGLGDLADYLKKTIDDIDVKEALNYLKREWLAFWNTLKGVGAEVSALVGTFNEVKEAVKGFFSEGKTIWETTKQEFGLVKDVLSVIGDMGQNTKREWEALKPVVTAVGAVLKSGWDDFVADATEQWPKIKELAAGVFRTITDGWNTFEGAVRRGFESLKEFIVGLTGKGGVNRNAPPSNAEDDLPGLRKQMSFGGSDISLDNARFQLANFGTGTAGAEMRGNIDRALIHISGTMQAIIQNASIMGRTGLDTGPAGVQNASWGGAGTGGFGGGVGGVGRDRGGFESNPAGGAASTGGGGAASTGAPGSAPAPGKLGERQSQAMRFATDQLRKEGVPEANLRQAAAHLVGQATMESGLDPTKTHDIDKRTGKPTGYGIYGARDPTPGQGRKTNMLNWMREQGYAQDSLEGQTRYMAHEAMSGRYPQTRRALMTGQGPEATDTITKEFESPAVVNARSGAVRQAFGAAGAAGAGQGTPSNAAGGDIRGTEPRVKREAVRQQIAGLTPEAREAARRLNTLQPGGISLSAAAEESGHAKHSTHYARENPAGTGGRAVDIQIKDLNMEQRQLLLDNAKRAGFTRVGISGNHLHADMAGRPGTTMVFDEGGGQSGFGLSKDQAQQRLNQIAAPAASGEAGGASIKRPDVARAHPEGGAPITRPDVAGNQPIIVPPRAGNGIDRSTVAAQGPAAEGAATRTFKSASEGAAFGQSAAENIRKGLEGTNIPVSGVPSTSRGVSPNTGPKSTGGDAPTSDV